MRQRTVLRRIVDRLEGTGETFGARVRYWQRIRHLNDQELASKARIEVEFLKQIKGNSQQISKGLRNKLAQALNVTVAELAR